jgi:hypothetical protein
MRRLLWTVLFSAASIGVLALPAGADVVAPGNLNPIVLSYDFSNNSASASATNGPFNITVDILPEHTPGFVRVTAVAPDGSGSVPLVCAYQPVQQSQVQCSFNFTTSGLWSIRADYSVNAPPKNTSSTTTTTTLLPSTTTSSQIFAVTVLRVGS